MVCPPHVPEPAYTIVTAVVAPDEYCGTFPVSAAPVTVMEVADCPLKVHVLLVQVKSKLPPDSVNAVFPLSGAFMGCIVVN